MLTSPSKENSNQGKNAQLIRKYYGTSLQALPGAVQHCYGTLDPENDRWHLNVWLGDACRGRKPLIYDKVVIYSVVSVTHM